MAGALDGIRVIDFGQWIAGPLSALLLADQGAEVIHVDPPGGPRWQGPANATLQRGKKSISLDLKSNADLSFARALIGSADVLIENFRPGVMDRLGLGWDAVRRGHDRLIYCSLPGFAADDPRAANAGLGRCAGSRHRYIRQSWSGQRQSYIGSAHGGSRRSAALQRPAPGLRVRRTGRSDCHRHGPHRTRAGRARSIC